MSDKPFDANEYMAQAEAYQRHFVAPLIDALKNELDAQLKPLVDTVNGIKAADATRDEKIERLEANQHKALLGYTAFIFLITTGLNVLRDRIWTWMNGHRGS